MAGRSRKGRKAEKRLDSRRADFTSMTNGKRDKGYQGFKKPGSNKK